MDPPIHLLSIREFCFIYFQDELRKTTDGEPTKSMRNTISRLCRDGIVDAVKYGRRWFIKVDGTCPRLEEERKAAG